MNARFPSLQPPPLPTEPTVMPDEFTHLINAPTSGQLPGFYPVGDLNKHVWKFLATARMPATRGAAPRQLFVVGPPGSGKSAGVKAALSAANVAVALVPPNMLASEVENGATEILDRFMTEMSRYSHEQRVHVAVIMEDVDTSILARDEKTSVTPNARMVAGRLQFIADHPELYPCFDGSPIPLVFTANRPDELRESLLRPMRTTFVEHNPSPADVYEVVYQIFAPRTAEERSCLERLFNRYRRENLSFWQALRHELEATKLDDVLTDGMPGQEVLEAAMRRRQPLTPALVYPLAEKLKAPRAVNYFSF